MKTRFLFPYYYKILGWLLLAPGLILGILLIFFQYQIPGFETTVARADNPGITDTRNYTQTLALALVIVGVIFVAFAKEKIEDELTAAIRRNALYWSILINYSLCIIAIIAAFIVGDLFWSNQNILGSFGYIIAITEFNLFTTLIIFLARYYYLLYSKADEYKVGKLSFLPYRPYRVISTVASVVLLILFLLIKQVEIINGSVVMILLSMALLTLVFTRQKHEDEMVVSIRMESMQLALYFNYGILLLVDLLVYGNSFWSFMFYNLFSLQLFFLIRFQFMYIRLMREGKEVIG